MNELDPNDKRLIATEYFDRALGQEELAWFDENGLVSDPVVKETIEEAESLRKMVRQAERPEPPAAMDFYWQRVRSQIAGEGARKGRGWGWMRYRIGPITPLRGVVTALGLALGVAILLPRQGPLVPRVERAESRQPGLYTSIVPAPAESAGVVWITGLEYLPEGYVLR
ncbi:MAG TPA: hypothetical protein PLU30_13135 [Verrucomicrobiae bacterium]|nr:hypothetical protein [Verrucomicrobiae bacterium]